MKPIIGISANMSSSPIKQLYDTHINYIPTQFEKGITLAGGIPIIFPVSALTNIETYVSLVDGIVFIGGYDISPQFYNEEPTPQLQETLPPRDIFEIAMVKEAMKQQKPIFGICRGMQLINVANGGSLYQDINTQINITVKHLQNTNPEFPHHFITTEKDSHINRALGDKISVNTLHHQAIKSLASNLKVTAYSSDHIIECIESNDPGQFILGVQWHPEILLQSDDLAAKQLFTYFVNHCLPNSFKH